MSGLNSQPHITILSAPVSANQSSDQSSMDAPQVGLSSSVLALIITLTLLLFCVVCPIGTYLWIRRRHRLNQGVSTNTSERTLEPGQGHSRHNTSSNLSEFDVDALTVQEQLSAPPTMDTNMAAAMLNARGLVSTPSRSRQLATTVPSGSATGHPDGVLPQAMHTTGHTNDQHPAAFLAGSATPLVDPAERRLSRTPTAFFARLSHNFAAAFSPQESEVGNGDGDDTSTAESDSTPMALGVRLNHQPTATAASSTLHGSDSEVGSGKGKWLRYSTASHSAHTGENTRTPSFSSRASLGHSQGQGGLRVRLIHPNCKDDNADACFLCVQRDLSPSRALDILNDVSPPGSAQSGQLSLASASTGMVTALTHQTDHT